MLDFLKTLLPRLRMYSQSLNQTELFVDKPWIIIDAERNQQTYIFRRQGELIMSLNGQVQMGKWEYITGADLLLIDRIADKLLLSANFFNEAVMVLDIDGGKEDKVVLINRKLVPDLDAVQYLSLFLTEKANSKLTDGDLTSKAIGDGTPIFSQEPCEAYNALKSTSRLLTEVVNGREFAVSTTNGKTFEVGSQFFVNGQVGTNQIFNSSKGWSLEMIDGRIARIFYPREFKVINRSMMVIIIERRLANSPAEFGDAVVGKDGSALSDGKYDLYNGPVIRLKSGKIKGFPFF